MGLPSPETVPILSWGCFQYSNSVPFTWIGMSVNTRKGLLTRVALFLGKYRTLYSNAGQPPLVILNYFFFPHNKYRFFCLHFRLLLGFMSCTSLLSMWLSNTSTAAMVMPIVDAVLCQLNSAEPEEKALTNTSPSPPPNNEGMYKGSVLCVSKAKSTQWLFPFSVPF